MRLPSRLGLLTVIGGMGATLIVSPAFAGGAGGVSGSSGSGGSAGASGGAAGKGGASGGAAGAAGSAGASGFTQAVTPKAGGAVAGTGNKAATYAVTCAEDLSGRCAKTGSIVFDKKQKPAGFGGFEFDTGWVPDAGPLAVRFAVKVPAIAHVHLETPFIAQWPDAITLQTPGTRKTGALDFNYGLTTEAKVKFDTEILNQQIYFEKDIPYIPKVNFSVNGARTFDPWAWDGIRAEGSTDKLKLIEVNILQLALGIPDSVGEAGLQLSVYGTLGVTYRTDRISITPSEGPITKGEISTLHKFEQGAWAEYKVHPEGTLDYDGTITLEPAFVVGALGKTFSIPIYAFDYPVDIPSTPYIFDDQLVHVPLPDLRLPKEGATIDLGKVELGTYQLLQVALPNIGEAKAISTLYLSDASIFHVLNKEATAEPAQDLIAKLSYQPTAPGPFSTTLLVASNDPDSPYIAITVKGDSVGAPDDPPRPTAGMGGVGGRPVVEEEEEPAGAGGETGGAGGKKTRASAAPVSGDEGGCGCRVTPRDEAPRGALFSFVGLASLLALRSRARRSPSPPARNTAR